MTADTVIECIVRVSDGSFESKLAVPVNASKEQLSSIGEMWMTMLLNAVKMDAGKPESPSAAQVAPKVRMR